RRYTPLLVGRSPADGRPLAALPDLENHRHAYGGSALRQIEYVASDHFLISPGGPPHPPSSLTPPVFVHRSASPPAPATGSCRSPPSRPSRPSRLSRPRVTDPRMRCKRFEPVRAIERPPDAVPCLQDCIGAVERPRSRHSVRPPGRPATAPQFARGRRRIERVQRVERHRRQPPVALCWF